MDSAQRDHLKRVAHQIVDAAGGEAAVAEAVDCKLKTLRSGLSRIQEPDDAEGPRPNKYSLLEHHKTLWLAFRRGGWRAVWPYVELVNTAFGFNPPRITAHVALREGETAEDRLLSIMESGGELAKEWKAARAVSGPGGRRCTPAEKAALIRKAENLIAEAAALEGMIEAEDEDEPEVREVPASNVAPFAPRRT